MSDLHDPVLLVPLLAEMISPSSRYCEARMPNIYYGFGTLFWVMTIRRVYRSLVFQVEYKEWRTENARGLQYVMVNWQAGIIMRFIFLHFWAWKVSETWLKPGKFYSVSWNRAVFVDITRVHNIFTYTYDENIPIYHCIYIASQVARLDVYEVKYMHF